MGSIDNIGASAADTLQNTGGEFRLPSILSPFCSCKWHFLKIFCYNRTNRFFTQLFSRHLNFASKQNFCNKTLLQENNRTPLSLSAQRGETSPEPNKICFMKTTKPPSQEVVCIQIPQIKYFRQTLHLTL